MSARFPDAGCGIYRESHSDLYRYDRASDTLTDVFGITWQRVP